MTSLAELLTPIAELRHQQDKYQVHSNHGSRPKCEQCHNVLATFCSLEPKSKLQTKRDLAELELRNMTV